MSFRFVAASVLTASSLLGAASPAMAASLSTDSTAEPSEEVAAGIYRICQRMGEREKVRCEARQLARWRLSLEMERPRNAIEIYKDMDLGQTQLRKRLQEELLQRALERGSRRKSYRESETTDDINTDRRSYLKDYREQRLQCMLLRPGRSRSMCLDRLGNEIRDVMRATRGTLQYPAQ